VKGYDERAEVKSQAAQKWVDAVNADRAYDKWAYSLARKPSEVKQILADSVRVDEEMLHRGVDEETE
jgi:hypothetical protein